MTHDEIHTLIEKTLTGPMTGAAARLAADKLTPVLVEFITDNFQKWSARHAPGSEVTSKLPPRNAARDMLRKVVNRRIAEGEPIVEKIPPVEKVKVHEILVGNVGVVYIGTNGFEARKEYNRAVGRSRRGGGREEGEPVTHLCDGAVIADYRPAEEQNDR